MFHLRDLTTTNSAINPQPLDHEPVYVDPSIELLYSNQWMETIYASQEIKSVILYQ